MVTLYDVDSGAQIGSISQAQLKALIDWMEEEYIDDRDYYVSAEEVELMEEDGIDPALTGLLRQALRGRQEMDIRYATDE